MPDRKPSPARLVIATRASRLALWQAEHVKSRLLELYPQCDVSLLEMTTRGDQILDRTLSKVGGKGLFVKELETALLDGRADLAVHSLKDVPVDLKLPFALTAVMKREDPRDALVSNQVDNLSELPPGAVVGTSSLRREAQIRALYPHLEVRPLRGNLDTRLGKLDRGEYAAIILAAAGLQRLGLSSRIRSYLAPEQSLPSAGQGALGIEVMADRTDLREWLAPLECRESTWCALAERTVSAELGGSCQVPLAAYAQQHENVLHLRGLVAQPDGSVLIRAEASGAPDQAEALGRQVAAQLLEQGARDILATLLPDHPVAGSPGATPSAN
ncbi:MAG TPA: hydroxymethylbilane synthase [Pusillimonas sp.]|uniref:hydroxymethylbilane synthase n=1 Tax=unclassified Pusillimonas TaxID=2640016 RepID=UPI0026296DE3|nr:MULTISPECIES: hydroxymethylbilane synthase [unclassified Pusillimonas]HLU19419.1 hydroxymethylbilane synthase [Pusillimonas sp.]